MAGTTPNGADHEEPDPAQLITNHTPQWILVGFEVRTARPEEYSAVGDLTVAGYANDGFGGPGYESELRQAASRAAEADLLVAVDSDDTILGTVTWCPPGSPWREMATEPDQGEFRMLTTSPAARRRGVARALVDACLDRARKASMSAVLICSGTGMVKAHSLYRSLGFQRAPELDWTPRPEVSLLGLRLNLSSASS
jgi:ribosomal protein S18 acetylase RimI-like enzyme